jgi:leader peptidase (prepilin peptidase)/N-methyltransferase
MLEATLALLAGLLIGSFLNVCIYRLPRDLSVVSPRSFCPACEKPIAWYDNIPLVSYILLGGRCRQCGGRIPLRYPLVELLTGTLFVMSVAPLGMSLSALKWCLFGALMTGMLFSDLEQRILPDQFTLGGTAAGLALAAVVPMDWGYAHLLLWLDWSARWVSVGESVLGAAVGAGMLWGVGSLYAAVRHKEGLGLGDVKMLAMIGSFLGLHGALQALIVGSLAGSVIGLIYIRLTRKDYASYELPFGTFLAVAGLALGFLQGPVAVWMGRGGG